jgi:hypothetical protein
LAVLNRRALLSSAPQSQADGLKRLNVISLRSRIKPLLEMRLEALEHLFFDVFDVSELAPTTQIGVFRCSFDLHNKFFDQLQLVPVLFPEMLLANVRRLSVPVLGS